MDKRLRSLHGLPSFKKRLRRMVENLIRRSIGPERLLTIYVAGDRLLMPKPARYANWTWAQIEPVAAMSPCDLKALAEALHAALTNPMPILRTPAELRMRANPFPWSKQIAPKAVSFRGWPKKTMPKAAGFRGWRPFARSAALFRIKQGDDGRVSASFWPTVVAFGSGMLADWHVEFPSGVDSAILAQAVSDRASRGAVDSTPKQP